MHTDLYWLLRSLVICATIVAVVALIFDNARHSLLVRAASGFCPVDPFASYSVTLTQEGNYLVVPQ